MKTASLIARLRALESPTPAGAFVLLWTFLAQADLAPAEDRLRRQGLFPPQLVPAKLLFSLRDAWKHLAGLPKGGARDLFALQLLKALDRQLADSHASVFERGSFQGFDGRLHRLRRRNNFLVDHFEERGSFATNESHQGRSLTPYSPFHVVIREGALRGIELTIRSQRDWGDHLLHLRLLKEREALKVMLWPFSTSIEYVPLGTRGRGSKPGFVRLQEVVNREALGVEINQALEVARERRVTLLIFPELAIPPALEGAIVSHLSRGRGLADYPLLTLLGLCHRPNSIGDLDLNEAVLLGPDGRELHRHRKLAPFSQYEEGKPSFGEQLEVGRVLSVLESALGNLSPLICLELFHDRIGEALSRSHANLLVVPSLSPKTSAHRTAASRFQATLRAGTFVCNRPLLGPPQAESSSFYQVPCRAGFATHWSAESRGLDGDFLLFSLEGDGRSRIRQV